MEQSVANLAPVYVAIIITLALWSAPWKAVALWKAARRKDTAWYVVLLLVNTIAILDILYIFVFAKDKPEV